MATLNDEPAAGRTILGSLEFAVASNGHGAGEFGIFRSGHGSLHCLS
jgi:hypothetical protein